MTKHCNARPRHLATAGPGPGSKSAAARLPRHGAAGLGPGGLRAVPAADHPPGTSGSRPSASPEPAARQRADTGTASGATTDRRAPDRSLGWLRGAMAALAVLAAAAAVVSWDAQYVLVRSVKHNPAVAALEAGIPDIGALIFATLGIALALQGRRAVRARALNVACVGISLSMNALAATPGWADLAIWVMPSAVYALASDSLIGVVRAFATARSQRAADIAAADDEATPMAIIGGLVLWLVRLGVAPLSTIAGFRRWVLDECPVAPGRKAPARRPAKRTGQAAPALPPARPTQDGRRTTGPGKQARMLTLAGQRHDLPALPLSRVSGIANAIGAEVSLSPGTARRVLLAHVRALQITDQAGDGHASAQEGQS